MDPAIEARLNSALGSSTSSSGEKSEFGPRRGGKKGGRKGAYSRSKPYSKSGTASNRVFVGNLDYSTSWQDLKDHFSQDGVVTYVKIIKRGSGIVEFENAKQAEDAIAQFHDTILEGTDRKIFCREDRQDKFAQRKGAGARAGNTDRSGRQIFVDNLPYSFSWQDLKDAYKPYGQVERADIPTKGKGTVLFSTAEEAEDAIERTNEAEVEGRTIYVKLDSFV